MDQSELNAESEALSRVRAALDQAKKKLDDGTLPHAEINAEKPAHLGPTPGPLSEHIHKLQRINRILRITTVALMCGVAAAVISMAMYHVNRVRSMRYQISGMSAQITANREELERELQRHTLEVAKLNREVQDLRRGGEKKQPRKKFLGIF